MLHCLLFLILFHHLLFRTQHVYSILILEMTKILFLIIFYYWKKIENKIDDAKKMHYWKNLKKNQCYKKKRNSCYFSREFFFFLHQLRLYLFLFLDDRDDISDDILPLFDHAPGVITKQGKLVGTNNVIVVDNEGVFVAIICPSPASIIIIPLII